MPVIVAAYEVYRFFFFFFFHERDDVIFTLCFQQLKARA